MVEADGAVAALAVEAGAAVEAEDQEGAELAGKGTKVIRDCQLKGCCHG
jgi:hypothetical protein